MLILVLWHRETLCVVSHFSTSIGDHSYVILFNLGNSPLFYGDASTEPLNVISERISDDLHPQMKILNMAIPILTH